MDAMDGRGWCLENFDKNFSKIAGGDIAICGNKEYVVRILQDNGRYQIKCILDEGSKGKYRNGCYCIGMDQLPDAGIGCLLIADIGEQAEGIYAKIRENSQLDHMRIYDFYGTDMDASAKRRLMLDIGYASVCEESLWAAIDQCDVVSFDIGNTLFAERYLYFSDFFRNIGKKMNDAGIGLFDFMQSVADIKERDTFSNLRVIIEVIIAQRHLPIAYLEQIWAIVLEETKKAFIPRQGIVRALQYAKQGGKKVCIIEDMPEYRLPKPVWEMLLDTYQIRACDEIICSGDLWVHKESGLYGKIVEKYGSGLKYLHIGDELLADILIPERYGFHTFFIKSPVELFGGMDHFGMELLENNIVRKLFEEYLQEVYRDAYTVQEIFGVLEKPGTARKASELKEQMGYWRDRDKMIPDDPITYEPVIFDSACSRKKLVFGQRKDPKVSIIIPIYGQFGYTYRCLRAVWEHSGDASYEVILADDHPTEDISGLKALVSGATVLQNSENLKYLRNCNHAAGYARGEYILFLNNDTQVQPDWLCPLIQLLEEDPKVGMAGSKLVYPNGMLQEAGGIVWKDGSAWNYGRFRNPEEPEYCYVKEADYISGAAIMIRASLWKEIGGFDTRFVPAYYEDTDLAFEVRKRGYKVCLHPKSVVVHFEGVSNGVELTGGLKKYQVVNRGKFFEKWKEVLAADHFDPGEHVYLAKDRAQMKKRILVVDHYVPNHDKDAGGRCTYMYIQMFLRLGMKVTFIGDNFVKAEPYTQDLQKLGVEVLYGDFYYDHWEDWILLNVKYFDLVYLQRPGIAAKYIDLVRKYSSAKIFYFAHDLHYIRFQRDYQITGDEGALKESEHWKQVEMELFAKADVGHVVGTYEQGVLQEIFPDKRIRNIPLYIYDGIPDDIEKDFSKRRDILFVGGFHYKPNVDAVLWFARDIFPRVLGQCPKMVWHIVGSNPPEEICRLASGHIVVEGFVTDEELAGLYRTCRLVVVPLRFGAGVKGKIVEAAYHQIPVVTTSVGGEGLDASVGSFVIEDDEGKMAALIARLYTDPGCLREMSDAGGVLIRKYFTSKVAEKVLMEDM